MNSNRSKEFSKFFAPITLGDLFNFFYKLL
nr:MAG TPA: hypothetical protein [Caudoviricetes sp.]